VAVVSDPFIYGPAVVSVDGKVIGHAIEVTMWHVLADGTLVVPEGACPQCARVPLGDEPVVCEHGVATRLGIANSDEWRA